MPDPDLSWLQFRALGARVGRFHARQQLHVFHAVQQAIGSRFGDGAALQPEIDQLRALAYPGAQDTPLPMIPNAARRPAPETP